jgi:hypothetical protein
MFRVGCTLQEQSEAPCASPSDVLIGRGSSDWLSERLRVRRDQRRQRATRHAGAPVPIDGAMNTRRRRRSSQRRPSLMARAGARAGDRLAAPAAGARRH